MIPRIVAILPVRWHAVTRHDASRLIVTTPGEFRVLEDIQNWETDLGIAVEIRQDDRFLCPPEMFESWAAGRKQLRMDFFYREMRRHHDVLMIDGKPVGGKWNYDVENRERPDASQQVPAPLIFARRDKPEGSEPRGTLLC